MPINQEGYLLIIYSLNLYRSIIKDNLNLIRAKTTCVKIPLEVFEYGVEQKRQVIDLELFILYESANPFFSLLMDEISMLESFLMHFVQLIELNNYFLLCLGQVHP